MVTIPSDRLRSIEARVDSLSQLVQTLQAQNAQIAATSGSDLSVAKIQEPEPRRRSDEHLTKIEGEETRYVASTFWASMSRELDDLDGLVRDQNRYIKHSADDSPYASGGEEGDATMTEQDASEGAHAEQGDWSPPHQFVPETEVPMAPVFFTQPRTMAHHPNLLRQFPPKWRCDAWVFAFLRGYQPIVPLVHVPTFRRRYEQFWLHCNDPDAGAEASMSFAALLIAVVYAGSVCDATAGLPEAPSDSSAGQDVSRRLSKLGTAVLRAAAFPKAPTVETLSAYLVLQVSAAREEEPLTCVALVGLALRAANMLGLHRDPSHFEDIDEIEAEVRRRVWWHIVRVDVLLAIAAGLPPLIDLHSWDVRAMSELKDEYIGVKIGEIRVAPFASMVLTSDRRSCCARE